MVDYRDYNEHRDRMDDQIYNTSSRSMAGPIVGLVAVVAILAAIFLFASGGDRSGLLPADANNPGTTQEAPTITPSEPTVPSEPMAPATPVQ